LNSSFTSRVSEGDCRAIYQVRYNEFLTARQPGCYFCRFLDCIAQGAWPEDLFDSAMDALRFWKVVPPAVVTVERSAAVRLHEIRRLWKIGLGVLYLIGDRQKMVYELNEKSTILVQIDNCSTAQKIETNHGLGIFFALIRVPATTARGPSVKEFNPNPKNNRFSRAVR
jgi:hypothetical protein